MPLGCRFDGWSSDPEKRVQCHLQCVHTTSHLYVPKQCFDQTRSKSEAETCSTRSCAGREGGNTSSLHRVSTCHYYCAQVHCRHQFIANDIPRLVAIQCIIVGECAVCGLSYATPTCDATAFVAASLRRQDGRLVSRHSRACALRFLGGVMVPACDCTGTVVCSGLVQSFAAGWRGDRLASWCRWYIC